jgi:hypothetical protein
MPDPVSSLRENNQRPNETVLTPPGAHDIPAAGYLLRCGYLACKVTAAVPPRGDRQTTAIMENVPGTPGPQSPGGSSPTQDDGKPETDYHLIGSGHGGVYRWRGDYGLLEQGRRRCPIYLLDSAGKPVSLNGGSTWYEIAPTGAAVSY